MPWERVSGTPTGVGVCLSGGGLRAASYSFGVLQTLQAKLGLVYGARSAEFIAAVSGGSYIAATYMLGARARALQPSIYKTMPPLVEGSPEEAHVLSHGRYLEPHRIRFGALMALNIAALAMLFVWVGTMLGGPFVALRTYLADDPMFKPLFGGLLDWVETLPMYVLAPGLLASWFVVVANLYAEGGWRRYLLPFIGLAALIATWQPVVAAASRVDWSGWRLPAVFGILLMVLVLATLLTLFAQRVGIAGPLATGLNFFAVVSPRLLGLAVLGWIAVVWYRIFAAATATATATEDEGAAAVALVAFLSILVGALLFSHVPHRASLHREYRNRLMSCFAVHRGRSGVSAAGDTLLSLLAPPAEAEGRFPRLLVCATANVHVRLPRGRRTAFVPFILSHDVCGVPGHRDAAFATAKLELIEEPAGVLTRKKEPLVSLFTAVAATGAAISPSMGRKTLPSLRMLIAAANIRLGRWVPNPFSPRARKAVSAMSRPGRFDKDSRMNPGYNELIPEMLGFDGPRVYVSDGGHYDNLGLLALLSTKCAKIWCVDASPEATGEASELRRVLDTAHHKMGINIDLDLSRFKANSDGLYASTHAHGTISYPDGSLGHLTVLKLGLTSASPAALRARRRTDPGFPHHSTFRHQVYPFDRMNSYRLVGKDAVDRCLQDQTIAVGSAVQARDGNAT